MTLPDPGVRDDAPPGTDRLLAGLTPEQTQAVTHGTGPLLLLAGPGAGKTGTLTHRAAYLLASGRAQPWEILAVTFSVRAAGELQLRLADLLGETVARGVTAATFHSVCARLLREHAGAFGRTEASRSRRSTMTPSRRRSQRRRCSRGSAPIRSRGSSRSRAAPVRTWHSSATGSTTRSRCTTPMSGSRWTRERMWPRTPLMWCRLIRISVFLSFLSFLPMPPSQILLNNLLYNTGQLVIPS